MLAKARNWPRSRPLSFMGLGRIIPTNLVLDALHIRYWSGGLYEQKKFYYQQT
jgi:hypothetical protein